MVNLPKHWQEIALLRHFQAPELNRLPVSLRWTYFQIFKGNNPIKSFNNPSKIGNPYFLRFPPTKLPNNSLFW